MNTPHLVILDEYGYYAQSFNNVFGGRSKRSIAKQMDIQQRWDIRCQKRKLNAAIGSEDKPIKVRKI